MPGFGDITASVMISWGNTVPTHSLSMQIEYLRTALEQEKKPIGFLLGAGAPMSIRIDGSPLIPGLEELTELVCCEINEELKPTLLSLLKHLPESESRNLESLLNYVRALKSLPGNEPIRGVEMDSLQRIDTAICGIVRKYVHKSLPATDNAYKSLAMWVSAARRLAPIQLFTTNYDLLIEQALENRRIAYFDGFMGSHEPIFDLEAIEEDTLPARWTLLWKLHGSINWSQDKTGNIIRRPVDPDDQSSVLIYPSHLKYDQSRRLPYLAMMDRLKTFLRKPGAVLISCGFSFRDQHINEVIDQGLRINPTASVHGLLYGDLDEYTDALRLGANLYNLTLFGKNGAVVGGRKAGWESVADSENAALDFKPDELGDFGQFGLMLKSLTGASIDVDGFQ